MPLSVVGNWDPGGNPQFTIYVTFTAEGLNVNSDATRHRIWSNFAEVIRMEVRGPDGGRMNFIEGGFLVENGAETGFFLDHPQIGTYTVLSATKPENYEFVASSVHFEITGADVAANYINLTIWVSDVNENHENPDVPSSWAIADVNTAISKGIVPANLQSKYAHAITRAEFASLAVALYEFHMHTVIIGRVNFSDTSDVSVEKAAAIGVVNGIGNNMFNPNGTLSRQQAATMLARLAEVMNSPLPKHTSSFADSRSVASWAAEAVGQMQASGIMGGVGNNMFSPTGTYTRQESIVTILRLLNHVA